jgi:hypothetical protein
VTRDVLKWCGFPHSRVDYVVSMPNGRDRIQVVAAREAQSLADYDAGADKVPEWARPKVSTPSIAARLRPRIRSLIV